MKIVCLQLEPKLGQVQQNMDRATDMLSSLNADDVDVLVLPEMAFSGYVFTGKDHIRPYLEDTETGPSVQWAKKQAIRLQAHVVVGFPERRINNDTQQETYYNSSAFVSPQGELLEVYSKTFLYYTDESWAEEGPGFTSKPFPRLGQVGFGICMDVNPYQFKADFGDFEFANFHLNKRSDLILCSMAWNKGEDSSQDNTTARVSREKNTKRKKRVVKTETTDNSGNGDTEHGDEDDDSDQWRDEEDSEEEQDEPADKDEDYYRQIQFETLHYWAVRMNPFYTQKKKPHHGAIFVVANRIGIESDSARMDQNCLDRFQPIEKVSCV
ncbi:Carbon-nitrogen hydrolase [Actinomortierella ambigua]|uniref:Carbon-nitrogen hydrolase n=1 Tax=Actinomortierella ambigua TaxID=1343610 RepID=A0A9P6QG53_9FUNG|nr:Carbon-nitrogen hydrolase [Actinomortierella ambigua]